jgi:hypothetical protein
MTQPSTMPLRIKAGSPYREFIYDPTTIDAAGEPARLVRGADYQDVPYDTAMGMMQTHGDQLETTQQVAGLGLVQTEEGGYTMPAAPSVSPEDAGLDQQTRGVE